MDKEYIDDRCAGEIPEDVEPEVWDKIFGERALGDDLPEEAIEAQLATNYGKEIE